MLEACGRKTWNRDGPENKPMRSLSTVSGRSSFDKVDHFLWIASRVARRLDKFISINCEVTSIFSNLKSCGHLPLTSGAFRRQDSYLLICALVPFFQIYVFIFNPDNPADGRPMLCGGFPILSSVIIIQQSQGGYPFAAPLIVYGSNFRIVLAVSM